MNDKLPQYLTEGNIHQVREIKRYALMGYEPHEISKLLKVRLDDVQAAILEMDKMGLLLPETAKVDIEQAYDFQIVKTKNWTIEGIAIAIKLLVNDLGKTSTNQTKIETLRKEIRELSRKTVEFEYVKEKISTTKKDDRGKLLLDAEEKQLLLDINQDIREIETEIEEKKDDINWLIKTTRKVASKDILGLIKGLEALETIEHDKVGRNINQNTVVLAGLSLKEAREAISKDPVMQDCVSAEFQRLDDDKLEDELMEGYEDFKSGTKL